MATDCLSHVTFEFHDKLKPVVARFDQAQASVEHAVSPRALDRMGRTMATPVIAHPQKRLKGQAQRITIDLAPTDDPTQDQPAFIFVNGHYDTWCELPLVATLPFNDEAEPYLVALVLRPGNSPAKHGARGLLRTLLRPLRRAFPGAVVRIRVDGGFAVNDWGDCLETQQVESVVGLAGTARLVRRTGRLLGEADGLSTYSGRTEHACGETGDAARSWSHQRRVIIKAEGVRHPARDPRGNPRVVVPTLREAPATV